MDVKIETVASAVAIFISLGTIFYHAVVIKKDVENLSQETKSMDMKLGKNIGKISMIEGDIKKLNTDVIHYGRSIEKIDNEVTEIQKQMASSVREVKELLAQLERNN